MTKPHTFSPLDFSTAVVDISTTHCQCPILRAMESLHSAFPKAGKGLSIDQLKSSGRLKSFRVTPKQ